MSSSRPATTSRKATSPGAQFCDVSRDVSDTTQKLNFMRPTPEDFAAAMRRFGISNSSRVVTYSTGNPWWATRVWWLLREFGHDNAAVLNGGWQKWVAENRAVETGPAHAPAAGDFVVREVRNLMVGKEEVKAAVGDAGVCTLNALLPAQHTGQRRQQLRTSRPHRRQRQRACGPSAGSCNEHVPAG